MPRLVDPRRACLPLADWPAQDRAKWEAALAATHGRFSARGPAARLAPAAIEKVQEGYGRWLGFLRHQGWLDPLAGLAERPTEARAATYFDTLRALGNRDYTIAGRFQELRMALGIMAPGTDFGWMTRPGGVPLRQRLAMEKRPQQVHHSEALFIWGVELMQQALTLNGPRRRQVMLRDGLLIALLARRAPRMRSLLAMRLGRQLRRDDDGWWIALEAADVKNHRSLDYPVPAALIPWFDRYIQVERVELLAGGHEDAVWINWGGAPLGEAGLDKRIRSWSAARFGQTNAFGPHRFRHCLATTAPITLPEAPAVGSTVLGITASVFREHYDRGGRALAARAYLDGLAADRQEAREVRRRWELGLVCTPDSETEDLG